MTAMFDALIEEPEAFVKPIHEDVTPVNVPLTAVRLLEERVGRLAKVAWRVVAKRLVDVVFVPVAFVQVRFVKLDGVAPVTVRFTMFAVLKFPVCALIVVPEAVEKPSHVVVAPVNVPFVLVRFVIVPLFEVSVGRFAFVAWRVVANRFVLVVFVPVAFVQEMFVKKEGDVDETERLLTKRLEKEPFVANKFVEVTPVAVMFPAVRVVMVPDVEFKFVTVPFVEVRFVIVPDVELKFVIVPLLAVSAEIKLFAAFIVVPEAILKPNHEVEVPFVNVRLVKFAFVP